MNRNKFGYTNADLQDTVDALTDLFGWVMFSKERGFQKKVDTYLESITRTKQALQTKRGANAAVLRRRIAFLQKKARKEFTT